MIRFGSFDAPLSIKQAGERRWLVLTLNPDDIKDWCLSLAALRFELLEEITVRGGDLVFVVQKKQQLAGIRAIARVAGDRTEVQISPTELDFWLKFFLASLRDGQSAVDHIDLEISGNSPLASVVLMFERSAPAVSPDEARRRLNLA